MHAKETTEEGGAAQLPESSPAAGSRVHLAKLLAITVFQVREANRYSGLRSLHVVHAD